MRIRQIVIRRWLLISSHFRRISTSMKRSLEEDAFQSILKQILQIYCQMLFFLKISYKNFISEFGLLNRVMAFSSELEF